MFLDVSQNVAFEGGPKKAHQVSASNLDKFSIKYTARTLYLTICVVNDYKHNSYLTIEHLNYDFSTNKSLLLEKLPSFGGPFYFDEHNSTER